MSGKYDWLSINNKYLALALGVVIIILLIWMRTGLLQYQGLFEPDGFFYYTAIKQAIASGFVFNNPVQLSGYPYHNILGETPGLLYFTIIPYIILQFFGMSPLDVMRYMAIVAGIGTALLCYVLVQHMSKSRVLGLLAMFFVACSSGNIARTAGTVYRGDTFVMIFVLLALIFLLKGFEASDMKKKLTYIIAGGFVAGSACLFWNGGSLALGVYTFAVMLAPLYGFVSGKLDVIKNSAIALGGGVLGWQLQDLYKLLGWTGTGILTGWSYLVVLVPMALGLAIMYYILTNEPMKKMFAGWERRTVLLAVGGTVVGLIALSYFSIPGLYTAASIQGGSANIANTTQELQAPTWDFIWASFGLELLLAPIGVIGFLLLAHHAGNQSHHKKGFFTFNFNIAFIACFGFLLATAYLQSTAIRYNAMLAIPLAIFSAYAIYSFGRMLHQYTINLGATRVPVSAIYAAFAIALLVLQITMTSAQSFTSAQADGINPLFLSAMSWMSNNTATNAKVLTLWPDGSVVEAWANRQSFMDSVGGENATRIPPFARYVFNQSTDSGYLINTAYKPDYLVVRSFWLDELAGIAIEGNITQNLTAYGFDVLPSITESGNATNQVYQFADPQYAVQLVVQPQPNNTRRIAAYLGLQGQNRFVLMQHIIFINGTTGGYTLINTPNTTQAINYTLMVVFNGTQIVGGTLLGPKLPATNMFKWLFECNYQSCNYGDRNVSATLVYQNQDTKIIHFIYH